MEGFACFSKLKPPVVPLIKAYSVTRLILFIWVFLTSFNALAGPLEPFNLKGLTTGAIGMVIGHELGHLGVAASMDIDTQFDGLTVVYPGTNLTSKQQLRVASAGFQSQWLLSELAFHYLNHTDADKASVAAGAVLAHLGITAAYLTLLKNEETGDVAGISNALGKSRSDVALLLAVPAFLDTWRLFGEPPDWVPQLSRASKGLAMVWLWAW